MPEIDANEANQLASLTGRTVVFARSSEGDGCTRTRHGHLGRRGPCTTFSTGVSIRRAHCSARPHTLGGVGRWQVLVCTAAVHPIKNGSAEKKPAPKQNKNKTNRPPSTEKKNFCRMKEKHSKGKKKPVRKERNAALGSFRVTYHLPDHSASDEVHEIPAIYYTGTFLPAFQYATFWAVSGTRKSRGFIRALVPFVGIF